MPLVTVVLAGCIGLQEKQPRLPPRLELDPALASTAAIAAAALAFNNGNPAEALLDLVHMAICRAATKESQQSRR